MKFTLSAVVVLALAASQAAAVVPIPVKECTHSYVVEPGTPNCEAFATKFGVTFADLLKWNDKLRPDCLNLDVGFPICVSVTKGDCCLKENPKGALVPQDGVPPQPNLWDPAPYTKGPAATPTPTSSGVVTTPAATGTSVVAPVNGTASTASPTSAATVPPTTITTSSGTTPTPKVPAGGNSAASSSKASMVLAAAGVVLSVAYML
ncbi:hypothetical protein KI688_002575 [Linnemannia hyalina]|uniref:LysM domain-containing protein n=1 Tax=Linnemannia hyalina TaxID=64524 RepID=A0A9P7XQI9_9FUNG|nr:hypothetical protein KI688_002575 [Linnemannia hyalina]